ncbi:MAG: Ig-like domain-containing protein, partial [Pseudomonadota bacterium]|nr:Ig-like domain-containing protein [Pseudomonadota bacterium]
NYTNTSVTRTVGGRTFTLSGVTELAYEAPGGIYANESGSAVKLTIEIENNYSFDIDSFQAQANSASVSMVITYANNTDSAPFQAAANAASLAQISSFSTPIQDIKKIVITSTDFAVFQNFVINDIKQIPTASAPRFTGDAENGVNGLDGNGTHDTGLSIAEDASATAINSLLAVSDTTANGQTLTWSVASAPSNGTLNGISQSTSVTGGTVTPTGMTYTPTANYNGSDSFQIQVSDGTETDTVTVNVTVSAANDAPSVTANGTLPAVDENDYSYTGRALNTLGITTSDVDSGASIAGYAIVGNSIGSQGSWSHSPDGDTWTTIYSDVANANALVLTPTTQIRFVQNTGFTGEARTLTFRALDNTYAGGFGEGKNVSSNGGTTAVSSTTGTIGITLNDVNVQPNFSSLDATPTFTEGGTAVVLDADVTISDVDLTALNSGNGNFAGATLTLERSGGANANDSFGFSSSGVFSVSGGNLQASAQTFATFTNTGGTLTINFTSSGTEATVERVNDVMQHITYSNTSDAPPGTATIAWTIDDGNSANAQGTGSALSRTVTQTVNITGVNDAPTLTATGANPTFSEGGSAVDLFSTVTASTVEAGQTFSALTLTVTNVSDGASEILAINSTDVALTNGNSGTLTGIGNFSVSVIGTTATVSVTGMTRDNTQMAALVDGITYRNTATPPATTARVVTLTGIQDNGGTANSGVASTTLALASTVTIDAAPTVTGRTVPSDGTYKTGQNLDFTVTYSENVTVNTGGGTPYIAVTLDTGGSVNAAYNAGASTATTLTFRYTVVSGNADSNGIAVTSTITLNGGTIRDSGNANAQATSLGFGSTAAVLVDGVAPTVNTINRETPSGATTNATSVTYRVTFAETVTGVDAADFTATTASGTATGSVASVSAVSGSVYDVMVNTISGTGTLRLDLNASGTDIADSATNAIATGYTSGQTYNIDNTAPTVTSVGVPNNGTYLATQNLDFTVNWSESVTVDTTGGTPAIALTIGATGRSATYQSG